MSYYHPMMHPFIVIGIGLFWLIVAIVVAYLIYKLIKNEKILVPSRPAIRSAEDILAERYAKGEQYVQMKEDLKKVQLTEALWVVPRPYHVFKCVRPQACMWAKVTNHL